MSEIILDIEEAGILVVEDRDTDVLDSLAEPFIVSVGERGPPGVSDALPGGTTGQLRAKASDANYDEEWIDPPESLPTGGTAGQILTKQSGTDGDAAWADPAVTGATAADKATLMAFAASHG